MLLLLTIYVGDLMLSGPAKNHYKFWRQLEKEVKIEPEEELNRYLGRYHTFSEKERVPDDIMASFKSRLAE